MDIEGNKDQKSQDIAREKKMQERGRVESVFVNFERKEGKKKSMHWRRERE